MAGNLNKSGHIIITFNNNKLVVECIVLPITDKQMFLKKSNQDIDHKTSTFLDGRFTLQYQNRKGANISTVNVRITFYYTTKTTI